MTEQDATEPGDGDEAADGADGAAGETAAAADDSFPLSDVEIDGDAEVDLDADVDVEEGPDEALVERVRESDAETVARELSALRARTEALAGQLAEREDELEDVKSKLRRKQADFENYKKRMKKRREQEKRRATEDLVERLLDVRDNLSRALDQDEDADIRDGVDSTLTQFDKVLRDENVEVVEPGVGDEVDPQRHEVLVTVPAAQPEGTIAEVHRPGYVMADKVLREAQVTVSDGSGTDEAEDAADADESEGGDADEAQTGDADEAGDGDSD